MALALHEDDRESGDVSTSVHPQETKEQKPPEQTYRQKLLINLEAEYAATEKTYEQLDSIDVKRRVDELQECRTNAWFCFHLGSGTVRILSDACRLRWCPLCSKARSRIIVANLEPWLSKSRGAKFLTLTLRHTDDSLSDQIDRLYDAFKDLRRRKYIKDNVRGGVWFFQVKWIEESQQWHPHLHCALDAEYMPHKVLKQLWHSVTGDSDIVDIRAIRNPQKAAEYIARYAARPALLEPLNNWCRLVLVRALHGRRLCGKWGLEKSIRLSATKGDVRNEYVPICHFQELVKLSKSSDFAESIRVAWSTGKPVDCDQSRTGIEALVQGMWDKVRPPPVVTLSEKQGVLFDDTTGFIVGINPKHYGS